MTPNRTISELLADRHTARHQRSELFDEVRHLVAMLETGGLPEGAAPAIIDTIHSKLSSDVAVKYEEGHHQP